MNPDDDSLPPVPPVPADGATAGSSPNESGGGRPRRRRGPRKPRAQGDAAGAQFAAEGSDAGAAHVDIDIGAAGDGGAGGGGGEGGGEGAAGGAGRPRTQEAESAHGDGAREKSGRRGRNRRRGRRGGERREGGTGNTAGGAEGAGGANGQDGQNGQNISSGAPAPDRPQAGELFAEVLSGAFDAAAEPAGGPAGDLSPPAGFADPFEAQGMAPAPADEGPRPADMDVTAVPAAVDDAAQAPLHRSEGSTEPEAESNVEPHAEPHAEHAPGAAPRRVLAPERDAPKLHKVLAQAGVGSRRDLEQMITEGRVSVNGAPAHTGQRISFGDRIAVDGKPVRVRIAPPPPRVLAYHKPAGEVVTHDDPQQRPTVFRRLPRLAHGKWQSVGRLDMNTEGLLLFTNSGEMANQLMHPRFGIEREYAVRSLGMLDGEAKALLLEGVEVDGQRAAFKSIEDGGGEGVNHWYRVIITEGRNREVRKLFEAAGHAVSRLIRIRYGSVVLPRGLRRGVWVDLPEQDVRSLRRLAFTPQQGPGEAPRRGDEGGPGGPRREGGPRRGHEGEPRRNHDGEARRGRHAPAARQDGPRAETHEAALEQGPPASYFERQERAKRQERLLPLDRAPKRRGRAQRGDADRPGDPVHASHTEDGDFGVIPNPLQQTFDQRALQQERALRHDMPEDGPIPNPLQQTYDKRALQRDRQPQREYSDDGPIPNPLQQTFDKRQGGGGGLGLRKGGGHGGGHSGGPGGGQGPNGPNGPNGQRRRGKPGGGKAGSRAGGGRGGAKGGGGKGGAKGEGAAGQPDPMRTSVGYIGADAFQRKGGAGRGGGRGGGRSGGRGR